MDPVTIRIQAEVTQALRELAKLRQAYVDTFSGTKFTGLNSQLSTALNTLTGDAAIRRGQVLQQVIEQIGGASKLTANEAASISRELEQVFAKYRAIGAQVPGELKEIARQTQAIVAASKQAATTKGFLDQFGGTQSLGRAQALVKAIQQLGGVERLTANEQRIANGILDEAEKKYAAIGGSAPRNLQKILQQTRELAKQPVFGNQAVADAERYVQELNKVGGITRLTANEQKKLRDIVAEGAAKLVAQGKVVPQQWQDILRSTQDTTTQIPRFFDQMFFRIAGAATVGALAGKVFVDAWRNAQRDLEAIVKGIGDLIERGAEVQNLGRSFTQLNLAIKQLPEDVLNKTRVATQGLVSDLKIMESSNRALLFGLKLTPDEFAKLTEAGIVLGRSMKLGPEQSIERLILALGRMSPRILDDLGIIVKIADANQRWADAHHVNVREMVAEQKQLAFQEEALRKIYAKTKDLGGIQLTLQDRITQLVVAWENYRNELALNVEQSGVLAAGVQEAGKVLAQAFGTDPQKSIDTVTHLIEEGAIATVQIGRVTVTVAKTVLQAWDLAQQSVFKFYSTLRTIVDVTAALSRVTLNTLKNLPGFSEFKTQIEVSVATLNLAQKAIQGLDTVANGIDLKQGIDKLDKFGTALDQIVVKMQKARGTKVVAPTGAGKPIFELGQGEEELTAADKEHAKVVEALEKRISKLNIELVGAYKNGVSNAEIVRRWGGEIRNLITEAQAMAVALPDAIKKASAAVAESDFEKKFKGPLEKQFNQFNQQELVRINREAMQEQDAAQKRSIQNLQSSLDEWVKAYYDASGAEIKNNEGALKEKVDLIHLEAQKRKQAVSQDAAFRKETIAAIDAWEHNEILRTTNDYQEAFKARAREIDTFGEAWRAGLEDIAKIWRDQWANIFSGQGGWQTALEKSFTSLGGRLGRQLLSSFPVADKIGDAVFKMFGQKAAVAMGQLLGPLGEIGGQIAVSLISKIAKALHQTTSEKLMKDIGRDWGVQISEGLADKIAKDAKRLKDRLTATLVHLPEIVEEAGGVTADTLDLWARRTRDLFSMVEEGKLSLAEAGKTFDEMFSLLADHIDKRTGLATENLTDLIGVAQRFKVESKALTDFVNEQTDKILSGFNAIATGVTFDWLNNPDLQDGEKTLSDLVKDAADLKKKIADLEGKQFLSGNQRVALRDYRQQLADTQKQIDGYKQAVAKNLTDLGDGAAEAADEFNRLQRLAVVGFQAGLASGKNILDVINSMGDGLDALTSSAEAFGFQQDKAFGDITAIRKFAKENEKLAGEIGGINDMAVGLANTNQLTAESFDDLQSLAGDLFTQIQKKGLTADQALQTMQPTLQALYELGKRNHMAFSQQTQDLIDQAKERGLVGDQFETVQQKQLEATEHVANVLEQIAKAMGVSTDAAKDAEQGQDKVGDAVSRVNDGIAIGINQWQVWANTAVDASQRAQDAVDGVSFGNSPGGLKEIPIKLLEAREAFRDFAKDAMPNLLKIKDGVNDLSNLPDFSSSAEDQLAGLMRSQGSFGGKLTTPGEALGRPNGPYAGKLVYVAEGAVKVSTWTIDEVTRVEKMINLAIQRGIDTNDEELFTFLQTKVRSMTLGL